MKKLLWMVMLCASNAAFAQKTDFTGNYKVNEEKVNWGPAPKYILPRYLNVKQLKDKIIISRVPLNGELEEQPAVTDTLTFDGKEFIKSFSDGKKINSSLKWSDTKNFVLIRKTYTADGTLSSTATESWMLEDAGKTLFINRDIVGGMTFTTKAYFDRQK